MGRAVIVGGGTDGRYTIEIDLGSGPRDERVAQLTAHIVKLTARISTLTLEVAAAQATADTARDDLDALASLPGITVHGSPAGKQFEQQFRLVRITNAQLGAKRSALDALKLQREKQQRTLTGLQTLDLVQQRQAWCADLTEDGSGAVATLEIPGESNLILIAPSAPPWSPADGVLAAREVMDPNQAYFNAAILPGWQKYKPTFRRGTITGLDFENDTADVALASHRSSAQQLNVDQQSTLQNVPVTYMQCNAASFELGDQVVVMFEDQNQSQPKVIGFVTDPKGCNWTCYGAFAVPVFGSNAKGYSTFTQLVTGPITVKIKHSNDGIWRTMTLDLEQSLPSGLFRYFEDYESPTSGLWERSSLQIARYYDSVSIAAGISDYIFIPIGQFFPFTTNRRIGEVAIYLGGNLVFNVAATDGGVDEQPEFGNYKVKTPGGIKNQPGTTHIVTQLTYTLTAPKND